MSYVPSPSVPPPKESIASQPALLGPERMQYLRSYSYIFENPNWTSNVMWGALCVASTIVIPILGQLVFLGYAYEAIESLYLTRGARYPDFNTNRFADYLMRGLWVFVVQLALSLVAMVVIVPIVGLGVVGLAVGGESMAGGEGAVFFGVGFSLLFLVLMMALLAMTMLMSPCVLRAGLSQEVGEGFRLGWAWDFVKRTWVEMLLGSIFLMVTSIPLALLGMAACYVGLFVAAPIITLASCHLNYQWYNLYLAHGGEPIPLKAQVPPAVLPPTAPLP